MKNAIKIVLVLGLLTFIMFRDFPDNSLFIKSIPVIILFLFMINLLMRNSLKFKSYFTSKYNFFTSKYQYRELFDIPADLLFEKINEVAVKSSFKIADTDNEHHQILLTTGFSLLSWGENVYIEFETVDNKTEMKVCSVTFFQIVSWGKNRDNIKKLTRDIESSFII